MSDKTELHQARTEMVKVLDSKLSSMPEWRALRAIDRALAAIEGSKLNGATDQRTCVKRRRKAAKASYSDLAIEAFNAGGCPMDTKSVVEYIARKRELTGDPKKVRITI